MPDTESLDAEITSRTVVVFHSSVTDLAALPATLAAARLTPRYIELGMGSPANRARFAELRERTGVDTLPLVFAYGECIGGIEATSAWAAGMQAQAMPSAAAWLGYGGLAPFALAALGSWLGIPYAAFALAAYAAVILSFVGALQWGMAVPMPRGQGRILGASVLPALVAWLALILPLGLGLGLLALAFVAWWGLEREGELAPQPPWLARLRSHLTIGAVVAILVGWVSLAF